MKKFYLLLIFCLGTSFAMAEFVNKKVTPSISTDEVVSHFATWFHTSGCTFELYDETTDEIGMRHQAYQQFYNGVAVENCILIVHSKNGVVSYINGDVMPVNSQPTNPVQISRKKAKKLANAKSANEDDMEQTIIHLQTSEGDRFYNAYKISGEQEALYVDVQTGEILKRVSHIQQSSVCNGTTKYSGARTFDAEVSNSTGNYISKDDTRNIHVCYALMDFRKDSYSNSYYFGNSTTDWNNNYLTSVTIESVSNKWWSNLFDVEDFPNLYIAITDANDNVLYRSDYKDMSYTSLNQYPVTFNIGKMIKVPSGGGYKIKIYDQDTYNHDLGFTVTLNSNSIGTHTWGQSTSNVKGSFEITSWHPAIDITWGLQQVYDYYLNVFNRHSFNNANARLNAILHDPTSGSYNEEIIRYSNWIDRPYLNAFAYIGETISEAFMHFGLGNEIMSLRVGLNTIGHEYTHLICAYRSLGNLEYKGEAGALNESIADIMAKNIEHYVKPSTFTWRYGCDHMFNGDCTRNFESPWEKGQPDCYNDGIFWINPSSSEDNGGVHTNSGVSNHWYYILCDGKTGTNVKGYEYNVTGIGIEKAQRIIFRTLINYLPPQATFFQARNLTIQAAEDLYGENSVEARAVDDAWKAVGVGDVKNFLKSGKYWIYTQRNDDGKVWFMSSNLGSASTKRLQADTLYAKSPYFIYDVDESFLWEVTKNNDSTYTIKNGNKYITWTSGNSANLSSTPTNLELDNDLSMGSYRVSINAESGTRYLSLNNTEGYDFFAFYGNTNQQCDLFFEEFYPYDTSTIRAKMPSDWQEEIRAWVWRSGEEDKGMLVTPEYEDGWYTYSKVGEYNIYFINGLNPDEDRDYSDTINVEENCCIKLRKTMYGRRWYNYISCDGTDLYGESNCREIPYTETFASSQGDFTTQDVILPDGLTSIWNWDTQYGMVAKAINGSTKYESEAWLISPCIELPEEQNCVLTFSHAAKFFSNTDQMTLYLTTDYITEALGESYWEQLIIPTYPTGTNWNWFESGEIDLSAYKGEHIVVGFRYVSDTNYAPQWEIKNFAITQSGTSPVTPPVETNRYIVLAQRDASSNWFYMTSDLGSASNKRYQAVDAGTNILANVSNTNLADKYYWEIEDNKLKTAAGYSTWSSGNSANLDATGKDLTIQQQADGTYTFSFADGTDTRYLSLNKTAGNDYFAYYKGTAQVYKLTLVKEGTTTPTAIENTSDESSHDSPIRKVIEDGQLYIILPNGTRYTATGMKVE